MSVLQVLLFSRVRCGRTATGYLVWTLIDFLTAAYMIIFAIAATWKDRTGIEVPAMVSVILDVIVHIYTAHWIRCNLNWIQTRIEWNRRTDRLLLLTALFYSLVNTVDPVVYSASLALVFPRWFRPISAFYEFYFAFVVSFYDGVFLFVVDKTMLAIARDLMRIRSVCTASSASELKCITPTYLDVVEDASRRFWSLLAIIHVAVFAWTALKMASQVFFVSGVWRIALFFVCALPKFGHVVGLYYSGQCMHAEFGRFRRLLLRESIMIRNFGTERAAAELPAVLYLRGGYSLSLKVFRMPFCWSTCLWYLGSCWTVAAVVMQFSIAIRYPSIPTCSYV